MRKGEYLTIERVPDDEKEVAQWFDTKHVYFVGSYTICSCGFPSAFAEVPLDYYDGMFDDNENAEDDLKSVNELLELLNTLNNSNSTITLYPVWAGDQGKEPKGTIDLNLTGLDPNHFFFNERFMYIVPPGKDGCENQ